MSDVVTEVNKIDASNWIGGTGAFVSSSTDISSVGKTPNGGEEKNEVHPYVRAKNDAIKYLKSLSS